MSTFGSKNPTITQCDPLTICRPTGASLDGCMNKPSKKEDSMIDTLLLQNMTQMYANHPDLNVTNATKKKMVDNISRDEKISICNCINVLSDQRSEEEKALRNSICGLLITNTINMAAAKS